MSLRESEIVLKNDVGPNFLASIRQFRDNRQLCDIFLKAGTSSFFVHRVVIAYVFPYFRTLFTNNSFQHVSNEITVEDIDPYILEILLNYAYGEDLRINDENIHSVIQGASFLLLLDVRDKCTEILYSKINPNNIITTKRFADYMDLQYLSEIADMYIRYNFAKVSQSEEFKLQSLEELFPLIKSDSINVPREEVLLEAIMSWVKYDRDSRTQILWKLLREVRLPLLSIRYLNDKILKEELIASSPLCKSILENALSIAVSKNEPSRLRTNNRTCVNNAGLIYVSLEHDKNIADCKVEVYDCIKNKWEQRQDMLISNFPFSFTLLDGKFYTFGGQGNSTVEVFNSDNKKWEQVSEMLKCNTRVAVLNNRAYTCGGIKEYITDIECFRSVECYCPKSNEWISLAPMNYYRHRHAVVELDGFLYALGGVYKSKVIGTMERYNPVDDTWTEMMPMLFKRCNFGATSLNGKIYACGGENNNMLNKVEVYDPSVNTWKEIAPIHLPRISCALIANLGKLYAIGGKTYDNLCQSSLEVYDPKIDKWTNIKSMTELGYSCGGCVVPY